MSITLPIEAMRLLDADKRLVAALVRMRDESQSAESFEHYQNVCIRHGQLSETVCKLGMNWEQTEEYERRRKALYRAENLLGATR